MTTATTDPKHDVQTGLDKLRELRDEVRVKLHLGGLDAKQEWDKIEPYLLDAEKAAADATHSAGDAVKSAVERLGKFRDELLAKAHDATKAKEPS